jgi:hypothetical protein
VQREARGGGLAERKRLEGRAVRHDLRGEALDPAAHSRVCGRADAQSRRGRNRLKSWGRSGGRRRRRGWQRRRWQRWWVRDCTLDVRVGRRWRRRRRRRRLCELRRRRRRRRLK